VRAVFNPRALVYHFKPRPRVGRVEAMLSQARAKARTAAALVRLHPHWRTYLATGINPVQRRLAALRRGLKMDRRLQRRLAGLRGDRELTRRELLAVRALANEIYYEELERAL
jgi:hypothetical protein